MAPALTRSRRGRVTRWLGMMLGLLLALSASFVRAADAAYPLAIGFSADGRNFAFAEWGVQDGSGFAYASVFVLDLPADRFLTPPLRLRDEEEQANPAQVLARALQDARPALDAAGIALPARLVYAAPFAGFTDQPVTVAIGWRPQWGLGDWAHKFDLTLRQFPIDGLDCGYQLQGFALSLNDAEFYHDEVLPPSRHCVLGYTLERVWLGDLNWPDMAAVALIGVHRVGFEGLDMRHIAVPIPLDRATALD